MTDGRPPLQAAVEQLADRTDDRWPGILTLGEIIHHARIEGA